MAKIINSSLKRTAASDTVWLYLMMEKAFIFERTQAIDSALRTYDRILEQQPDYKYALMNLGSLYASFNYFESAFHYLNLYRKRYPEDPLPVINFIYFKGVAGHYEEAIAYADTAFCMRLDSNSRAFALNNRGFAFYKLNLLEKAETDINAALQLFPDNSFAYRNRALLYIERKEFDKACEALDKTIMLGGHALAAELRKQYCAK